MDFLNHNMPVPDAHNCYPYKGEYQDRIDRALRTPFPVGIEQDVAWANGKPVVSHASHRSVSQLDDDGAVAQDQDVDELCGPPDDADRGGRRMSG